MEKDKLVEVTIDNIDQKTWSMLVHLAEKEGKTVDQVASEAIKWAYENDKFEEIAKEIKSKKKKQTKTK